MTERTYEQLLAAFQNYCKHDGGRAYTGHRASVGHHEMSICAICGWDTAKCQHRGEEGKFCSQCGHKLGSDT